LKGSGSKEERNESKGAAQWLRTAQNRGFVDLEVVCVRPLSLTLAEDRDDSEDSDVDVRLPPIRVYLKESIDKSHRKSTLYSKKNDYGIFKKMSKLLSATTQLLSFAKDK